MDIVKDGWEDKAWNSVLEIRSGRNQKEVLDPDGTYPIMGSAGKIMGYANDFLCEEGTTIIGRKGTIDKPLFIETKFWNVDTAFGLIAGDNLDKRFLFYFCKSFDFQALNKGTTLPSLVKKDLVKIQIPIPPLTEQKQIVALLDQAFKAIDQAQQNIEKNIANAKELFQSKLNAIFSQTGEGWEERSLGEVCHVLNGYAFKSKDTVEASGTQLLRMGNLYKNTLDLSRKPVYYPESYTFDYKNYLLKEGDLIMSLTGTVDKTDYGYTVKIPQIFNKLLLNQRIMKIEVHNSSVLNKDYLKHFFLSPDFLIRLYATASGTRQANLSSKTILTLSINFPTDINKQLTIVEQLDGLNKKLIGLENNYSQKLNNLEELKKSILQKAFNGDLT